MDWKVCLSVSSLTPETEKLVELLRNKAVVDVVGLSGYSLEGYDIFIGKKMSEETLATADKLKTIFAYKTGVDDFPMKTLRERGIRLVNSHASAEYVAEYTLGLCFSLVNRITESDRNLRKGKWYDTEKPYWKSLFGMKVGLLGYGNIGRKVHQLMERLGIPCVTLDRGKVYENIELADSVEALCDKTDLLVLSLPDTGATDRMVNEAVLTHLEGKYIVNVGRSNCFDEEALYNALRDGRLAGFASDTWDYKYKPSKSTEPWVKLSEYPFAELDNVVISPHQATRVADGYGRYVFDVLRKVLRYIEDGILEGEVNLDKEY